MFLEFQEADGMKVLQLETAAGAAIKVLFYSLPDFYSKSLFVENVSFQVCVSLLASAL